MIERLGIDHVAQPVFEDPGDQPEVFERTLFRVSASVFEKGVLELLRFDQPQHATDGVEICLGRIPVCFGAADTGGNRAEDGLRRARGRSLRTKKGRGEARFEKERLEFHRRVRRGYLQMARKEPKRFVVVPASGGAAELLLEWEHTRVRIPVRAAGP